LKPVARLLAAVSLLLGVTVSLNSPQLQAQESTFHNAPASARQMKNPFSGKAAAVTDGAKSYVTNCAACHGAKAAGTGNIPSLRQGPTQSASEGELFWFITTGDVANGMPSWVSLPQRERWEVVSYLNSLNRGQASSPESVRKTSATLKAPPPPAPFTDFRFEKPGNIRKVTVTDLPAPYATSSAGNGPTLVPRPADVWPTAPADFKVEQYATGLDGPRLMRTAPNGDVFLVESGSGEIKIFRGITGSGKPEQMSVFAEGLNRPFGLAFYPPGPDPHWVYVGNTNSVVRFAYRNGDLKASAPPEQLVDLPTGGHWTRDIQFSPDGKKMFVSVGSRSNVDDPDNHPYEKNRANVLEFNPDGSGLRVYASGIRNPVGLAISPKTGDLWCSVNERDALGDNLVPDYITHVQEGGFYGWPWWYIGSHQDPRHQGKHPELKNKVIVPDVLLQPHNASLQLTFYEGKQFPAEYQGDIFASEHGSWNRSVRVGYEVIHVPLLPTGYASGEYEDFLTGFVLPNGDVWGRPVGITVASDGSLLVSDDGSGSIWRISYVGKEASNVGR